MRECYESVNNLTWPRLIETILKGWQSYRLGEIVRLPVSGNQRQGTIAAKSEPTAFKTRKTNGKHVALDNLFALDRLAIRVAMLPANQNATLVFNRLSKNCFGNALWKRTHQNPISPPP